MIALAPLFVLWVAAAAAVCAEVGEIDRRVASSQARLAAIESQIDVAESARDANRKEGRDLANRLQRVEAELAERRQAVARLDQATGALTEEVARLRERLAASTDAVHKERLLLAARLRQLHEEGDPPPAIALLTSRLDPWTVLVDTRYQEAVAAATGRRIDHLTERQAQLETVARELAARQLRLDEEGHALTAARIQLAKKVAEQRVLLAESQQQGQTLEERLATLQGDRKRLAAMLDDLSARRQAVASRGQIAARSGHLPWPLVGDVVGFFGATPAGGGPPATGIRIQPTAKGEVRVVWEGDVVFADWFEGYGLLLIVDHGSGYYSLYGHASGLLAAAGDHVHQGEAIADTAGSHADPLYFEIRKDGRPVDPLHWLEGLAATTATADDE